jgi:hypothetical protein
VVVDDFTGDVDAVVAMAAAMAPFPSAAGTYYPGVRRAIAPGDAAWPYIAAMLEAAAPFVGGAFDLDGFDLLEASFSMVTAPPASLDLAQRAPHFDSTDPDYLAVLHYLSETPGTAFYRQRDSGIELVDADNVDTFVATARRVNAGLAGYTIDSNDQYERIGQIEGVRDRLAIYRGAMLHSGMIPEDASFSADPRVGRLTANIFIKGRRG